MTRIFVRLNLRTVVSLALLACLPIVLSAAQAGPMKAVGTIELKDATGDMGPIGTSSGNEPGLDVASLSIKSDGSRITLAATIKNPLGRFATSPVTLLIDVDNNAATGIKGFTADKPSGFEYKAELSLCMKYSDGAEACAGGSKGGKPTERYGAIDLKRFTGATEPAGGETVVDSMGFPGKKASRKTPVAGQVVEASFDYADIKVKPGQTIRLLARESGGTPTDGDGAFPIVLLTLK